MLHASTGNNTILPAKEESDYEPHEFHRFFPCTKAWQQWNSGLGEVGTETELGKKEGSETHSGISTCKTAHIQHLAPRERSMLQNMFPCTNWASFQLLCAHVPAALSALLEKHKKQRKYLHVHSVQCQARYQPCPIG